MEKQKTRIFRQSKASNYTVINNEILRRDDISWKAKGIMCYVLSLPDDWEIYLEELMKHATDGRDSFRSGWKELTEKGYVTRTPVKKSGKFVEWRTEIHENVGVTTISPHTGFPIVEKPIVGNPILENPTLLSTYDTKYLNKLNTNNNKDMVDSKNESDYTDTKINQFEEIWDLYPKNRRRNKKGCKAKFNKVVRKQSDIDKIKIDLLKYGEYIIRAGIQDEYIVTSPTYFNQERWNDDNSYEVKPSQRTGYRNTRYPNVKKETLPDWVGEQTVIPTAYNSKELEERLRAEGKLS